MKKQSWNNLLIQLHKLSKGTSQPLPASFDDILIKHLAQSQSILVANFYEALSTDNTLPNSNKDILWDLYRLFALHTMENEGYECKRLHFLSKRLAPQEIRTNNAFVVVFRCNAVSQADLNNLPARVQDLMARIRPHAVKLVDSWMIPDYLLDR